MAAQSTLTEFQHVPLDQLVESSHNPRRTYDEKLLTELAASIKSHGVLEPLIVRGRIKESDKYEIICGSRRYRAAIVAGLKSIPAIIKHVGEKEALEIQVIENVQRVDVHPLEEGLGYKTRWEEIFVPIITDIPDAVSTGEFREGCSVCAWNSEDET